jgi:hypothetical protein
LGAYGSGERGRGIEGWRKGDGNGSEQFKMQWVIAGLHGCKLFGTLKGVCEIEQACLVVSTISISDMLSQACNRSICVKNEDSLFH